MHMYSIQTLHLNIYLISIQLDLSFNTLCLFFERKTIKIYYQTIIEIKIYHQTIIEITITFKKPLPLF